jgi:integrase/recombinase XerD
MKTIQLDLVLHRGTSVVLIRFTRDAELEKTVRNIVGIRWTATHKAWHAPYSMELMHAIKRLFGPLCNIDASALKAKLAAYNNDPRNRQLSEDTFQKTRKFREWMLSRRYSAGTIETYTDALTTFLKYYHNKPVEKISNEDVIQFNNSYILANKLSSSFQNQVVNAIKLFFRTIQGTALQIELIHRPKREKRLPNVLSKEEVKLLLSSLSNLKHRAMLSLIYACGLRRSELLHLKLNDIDSNRKLVIIRQSKGKKDRVAPLSEKILELLRNYYLAYKPKIWLFESQDKNGPYNENSLAAVLKSALEKAGIPKPVTLHWLRHSYATHLLENGTDLRYIQEILGHSRSTTTEIYTHVSNKSIQKVISPFDSL